MSYAKQAALPGSGCQVVAHRAGQGGPLFKRRAAAWRPLPGNPAGHGCLPAVLRHRSVAYRHTLLRSSLSRAQTAHGAACFAYDIKA